MTRQEIKNHFTKVTDTLKNNYNKVIKIGETSVLIEVADNTFIKVSVSGKINDDWMPEFEKYFRIQAEKAYKQTKRDIINGLKED